MSPRELVVLGTASQVPTRLRNHNGYLLRWDGEGLLFDPGEGAQRQMLLAGVAASDVTRICITHFHGDHCLGLPGVLQRLSLDGVTRTVAVHFPGGGRDFFDRMRHLCAYHEVTPLLPGPIGGDGPVADTRAFRLVARRLSHPVETYGYRLEEPDGRRMLPDRLAEAGVHGPDIGRLQRQGYLDTARGRVMLAEVSAPRRGQRVAFVMDTRLCDAAFALAEGADMLVCESTFLAADADLATQYGHLTAAQAGRIAAESGARLLVLTHFSQRYGPDGDQAYLDEAGAVFGNAVLAHDMDRITVPRRR